jgi:hypothetical protein
MYLRLHEELGSIYEDEAFMKLFPTRGQPRGSAMAAGFGYRAPVRGRIV